MAPPAGLLTQAQALLRTGDCVRALALLRAASDDPGAEGAVWYLRSIAAQQHHLIEEAEFCASRATALEPEQPYFRLQAARVAQERHDVERAIQHFQQALRLKPAWVLALAGMSATMLAAGRAQEAVNVLQPAIASAPNSAPLWVAFGRALGNAGNLDGAKQALERAVSLDPKNADALFQASLVERVAGKLAEALFLARQAASQDPGHLDAHLLVGDLLRAAGSADEALDAYGQAATVDKFCHRAPYARGSLLWEQGNWSEALQCFGEAQTRRPDSLRVALARNLSLPQIYTNQDHLLESRRRFELGLSRLQELGTASFARPAPALFDDLRWCNFYLAYQGLNDIALQSRYGDLVHAIIKRAQPEWLAEPPSRPLRGKRLRVGFASHFFYDCTVGRYFAPWILGLDRSRFDAFVYHANHHTSPVTGEIRARAKGFRHAPSEAVFRLAQIIKDDQLDVLVYPELGMNPEIFALASLRLAPVQCAAWGHPSTTGLPTIDWFFSCEAMEPPDHAEHYRERVALLPQLGTPYARPTGAEPASRSDLGLPSDRTLYLVPQSLFKLHPDTDVMLASVLASDPDGSLVLFASEARPLVSKFFQRLKEALASQGISAAERVIFLPPMTHGAYLAVNRQCDVMLDPPYWSGGNTALDALAMALPIVSLPGSLMRGRQSSAMLRLLDIPELVATDPADYVRIATNLGRDRAYREHVRRNITSRVGALFGDNRPLAHLNDWLERIAYMGR